MARVWSLDGHVYEIDEETLAKYRIPDEQVRAVQQEPLPPPPPPRPQPPGPAGRPAPPPEADPARTPDGSPKPPPAP